jgi:hypothetical protein
LDREESKKMPGAAVQLRHHHALGAVDDERTVLRHQRDLAEVDRLLLDVGDRAGLGLGVDVPHDQANGDLDGRGERHAALAALVDVVLRLFELVADELQRGPRGEVLDGEHALEDGLQADLLTVLGRGVGLEERVVRPLLDLDEVADLEHRGGLAEAPAVPVVVRQQLGHRGTPWVDDP